MSYRPQRLSSGATVPTGWAYTDATREVECSRCHAPAGFYCQSPKGRKALTPHVERLRRYRLTIGPDEWNRRHSGRR